MWCIKCNRDLAECVCPDLQERLKALRKMPHVYVAPEKMRKYEDQAKKHKDDQTRQE